MNYQIFFVQGDDYSAFSSEYGNPDENANFWDRVIDDYLSVLEPIPTDNDKVCPNEEYWETDIDENTILVYREDSDIGYCSLSLKKSE